MKPPRATRIRLIWLRPVILTGVLAVTLVTSAAAQVPAPYGLFVASDGELKTQYSAELKATIVQLALTPPGAGGTLVMRAQFDGMQPVTPASEITILALPSINSNPNIIRNMQLSLKLERAGSPPVALAYFGRTWGDYGYIPPGGEVTRVAFTMSVAELRALLLAERVTGVVMNAAFEVTGPELASLRVFASTIGVPKPD